MTECTPDCRLLEPSQSAASALCDKWASTEVRHISSAHLFISDDLGNEVTLIGEVFDYGHAHTQGQDIGVLLYQTFNHGLQKKFRHATILMKHTAGIWLRCQSTGCFLLNNSIPVQQKTLWQFRLVRLQPELTGAMDDCAQAQHIRYSTTPGCSW